MGARGPKPLSAEQLARTGDRSAARKRRLQESKSEPQRKRRRTAIESAPARSLPSTDAEWRELCRMIPGYDPWDLADHFHFDAELAGEAITWIESHCRHIKGELAGQLIRLEDFQRAVVANLFGWVDDEGWRRYRRCLFYVPRKNAKTTLAACIALYVFFQDEEPGAEIYVAAAKEKQAKILWKIARSMILKEPTLVARLHNGKPYVNSILLDDEETFFQPIASEGKSEHGGSVHMAIVDELHAQANADIMEAMRTGTGARRQPIILLLTTADNIGESVCNDELYRAKIVRDNKGDRRQPGYDPTYLPVIYEATVEDDWTDPEVWRRANPLYDTSPTIRRTLEEEVSTAKDQPSFLNAFRRWYLNVQTETAVAWLRMDQWDKCKGEPAALPGDLCYVGLDLSSTTDMTALVAYFPDTHSVMPFYWVPEETAGKRDRQNDPWYKRWAQAGHLNLTSGDYIDYDVVYDQVDELAKRYKCHVIGIDPMFAAQPSIELTKRGYSVEHVRQGWATQTEACNKVEVLIASGDMKHGGHPVLRWNARNAKIKQNDGGGKQIVKPKDAAKIDGLAALLNALALAIRDVGGGVDLNALYAASDEYVGL